MKEREESVQRFGTRINSEVIEATPSTQSNFEKNSTKSSQAVVKPLTVMEELDLTFGPATSKPEVVKALEACTVLHRIPLPEPNVSLEQAMKDFYREKVLLNDVAFIPDKHDDDRSQGFSQTLHILMERLTRGHSVYDSKKYGDFRSVGNMLLQRACRTSAGADSFFTVQKLLCVEGTFLTQKSLVDDPPVLIDVFLAPRDKNSTSNHDLCARVQVSNSFAIFDVDSVDEITGIEAEDPQPWLDVESVVVDETNFNEGVHWRKLHLIVTNPETGVTYTSTDSTSALNEAIRTSGRITSRKILHDLSSWFVVSRPTSNRTEESVTTLSQIGTRGGENPSEISSVQENNRLSRFFVW